MVLPTILLALHPLLAVLAVLSSIPWVLRYPLGESTGSLRDLRSLFRAAEESKKLGSTERSVPDIIRLFLPTINRDFPVLNWPEERIAIGKRLVSVFAARQTLDLSKLVLPSESPWECIRLAIEDDRMGRLTCGFSDIVIHKTTITDYKNLPALTEIHVVSSVGFPTSLTDESVKRNEGKARTAALAAPHRVGTSTTFVFVHVQSVNVKSGYQKIVDISYSHCGVPLQRADVRICPFYKSALVQTDSMVWSPEEIEFQTLI